MLVARPGLHQEDPQVRCALVTTHKAEHAASPPPVDLSDPAAFSGAMSRGVARDILGNHHLKARVAANFAGVDLPVGHHHPAQIARLAQGTDEDFLVTHMSPALPTWSPGLLIRWQYAARVPRISSAVLVHTNGCGFL